MTLTEFVSKWNGKYLDVDGIYPGQCMDLLHQFCLEVLGLLDLKILAAPAAKDVYNNFTNLVGHEYFDRIANTPDGVPQEGDIVLWGSGVYGHVAIYIDGGVKRFRSFDQNYPVGSPCHIQEHNYSSCLGWLRFKKDSIPQSPELKTCLDQHTALVDKLNKYEKMLEEDSHTIEGLNAQIISYENFQKQIAVTLNSENDQAKILGVITTLLSQSDQLTKVLKDNETLKLSEATSQQETVKEKERADNAMLQNKEQADTIQELRWEVTKMTRELKEAKQKYEPIFTIFGLTICREVK